MSDDPMPAWARAVVQAVAELRAAVATREQLDGVRAAVMARIDRLQERVDGHADDLRVNLASAQRAADAAGDLERSMLDAQAAAGRRHRALADQVAAMERQILRLQEELRQLRGEGGA
jgi:ribosome-associated translation inhibitor RaiA